MPDNGTLDGAALDEADDAVCEPGPSGSGRVKCGALESADVGVGVTDGGVTSESECAGIQVGGVGLKTASALRLRWLLPATIFFSAGGGASGEGSGNPGGRGKERPKRHRWS